MLEKVINVAIGFATGRKQFQRTLRSYVYNWLEMCAEVQEAVALHLFISYDLSYDATKKTDFTFIPHDLSKQFKTITIIGKEESNSLVNELISVERSASYGAINNLFEKGYAGQRNLILYSAIKSNMDYLLFLDDDEYPVATAKIGDSVVWCGEPLLPTHLANIKNADITCGLHCGYISPIPHISFDNHLNEGTFRRFISAISNDIINWDHLKEVIHNNGVTYADPDILRKRRTLEVQENNRTKFISGSNLCINLKDPKRTFPFFNPPEARGEDTFLSTCLSDRTVLQVPVYTFHDGFGLYSHVLSGALPRKFKQISAIEDKIIEKRFYKACCGWIRYKPLFLYLTKPDLFKSEIQQMTSDLKDTLPIMCHHFNNLHYQSLLKELHTYAEAVPYHAELFYKAKEAWALLMKEQISI